MIYLILNYDIRIWEDDCDVVSKCGSSSRVNYSVDDDLFCNESNAIDDARQHLSEQNASPTGDKFVDVAVCFTMTATSIYDAYNGEHDVKYEPICSDIIIYAQPEEENNETYLFQ